MPANERAESYQSVQFQVPVQSHPSEKIGTVLAECPKFGFQIICGRYHLVWSPQDVARKFTMKRPLSLLLSSNCSGALNRFMLTVQNASGVGSAPSPPSWNKTIGLVNFDNLAQKKQWPGFAGRVSCQMSPLFNTD